jgi:hypothetical protein
MTRWTLSGGALVAPGRAPLPYVSSSDGFVLGATEPTWANSSLTRNEATRITTTADGQVIEGSHLPYGQIVVSHQNVTIRDCLINVARPTTFLWRERDTLAARYDLIREEFWPWLSPALVGLDADLKALESGADQGTLPASFYTEDEV